MVLVYKNSLQITAEPVSVILYSPIPLDLPSNAYYRTECKSTVQKFSEANPNDLDSPHILTHPHSNVVQEWWAFETRGGSDLRGSSLCWHTLHIAVWSGSDAVVCSWVTQVQIQRESEEVRVEKQRANCGALGPARTYVWIKGHKHLTMQFNPHFEVSPFLSASCPFRSVASKKITFICCL